MVEQKGVMIYEGVKEIESAFNNILNTLSKDEEYLVFSLTDELGRKNIIKFFLKYHKKRIEKGIKTRLIAHEPVQKIYQQNYLSLKDLYVKFSKVKLPTGVFVYGDNVMSVIWGKKPIAFTITSSENAKKYREFFEEMWKFALNP